VSERRDIAYEVDGSAMIGRLALPDGSDRRPAVLIAHEGNGLDEFQKTRADRFAELGYVAFALDYHGGGRPLTDRVRINERLDRLSNDPPFARRVAAAGLAVLLDQSRSDPARVVAVGYCFGGSLVLELARTGADLKAVVGFHPGLYDRRDDSSAIRGAVLVCVAKHSFTNPNIDALGIDALAYNARADQQSWRAMLDLFDDVLKT